jgi:hypothetical protein
MGVGMTAIYRVQYDGNIIANGEEVRIWKEEDELCLKICLLIQNLPRQTKIREKPLLG